MKLSKFSKLIFALVVALPARSPAAVIENLVGLSGLTIEGFDPVGQSFTAVDTDLIQISFGFRAMNPASPNDPVTMTLYSGSGFGGSILAQVTMTLPAVLPASGDDPLLFAFNFTGTSLIPGSVYTAGVTTSSSKIGVAFDTSGNLYSGGQAFGTGSLIFSPNADLVFRVAGRTANNVPDSSGVEVLALALASLAWMRHRMNRHMLTE